MVFPTRLLSILLQEIEDRQLPVDFMTTVENWYLPVARHIAEARGQRRESFMVSFNGAQGSGKSTITAFLRLILSHQFQLNTVEVSIDDFYLTHAEREELSKTTHPLLITRGVPGTHDVELARQTLDCLRDCSKQHACNLPAFDKAVDDRPVWELPSPTSCLWSAGTDGDFSSGRKRSFDPAFSGQDHAQDAP